MNQRRPDDEDTFVPSRLWHEEGCEQLRSSGGSEVSGIATEQRHRRGGDKKNKAHGCELTSRDYGVYVNRKVIHHYLSVKSVA